jgi:uncharacterized membrane protein YqjE
MAIRFAVFTILSIAACFWTINMARDPRKWRLLWLDFLTILDIDTNREQRRVQERQLGTIAYVMFVVFIVSAVSCGFWAVDQIREEQRLKTAPERDADNIRRQIERVAKMPRRR